MKNPEDFSEPPILGIPWRLCPPRTCSLGVAAFFTVTGATGTTGPGRSAHLYPLVNLENHGRTHKKMGKTKGKPQENGDLLEIINV